MKTIFQIFFLILSLSAFSQDVKDLHPTLGRSLDFGPQVQKEWEQRDKILADLSRGEKKWDALTSVERAVLEKYGEVYESMWDVHGAGCSWYCGGGPERVTASSSLAAQGDNHYEPSGAHDLSYKTAWVEGVPGYGIGEYLQYAFRPESPRVNTVIIANGYVKTQIAWKNNSRVKKLKMYVDSKPYAILNLKDVAREQMFNVGIIGLGDRENFEELKNKPGWNLRFEIFEVYEGDKYEDVAITELYFDGLDVHCLAKGTRISMADGSLKSVELLRIGDEVLSFNESTGIYESARILTLANPVHSNLMKVTFSDGGILVATHDHPLFDGDEWFAFHPEKTKRDYLYDHVGQLKAGQKFGKGRVISITPVNEFQETYTIVKMSRNRIFVANGILVGTEELRTGSKGAVSAK